MSKILALAFGLGCAIFIAVLMILQHSGNAGKQNQKGGNGFGESRAMPASVVEFEVLNTEKFTIDDTVAAKLRAAGYSTDLVPVIVTESENNNK